MVLVKNVRLVDKVILVIELKDLQGSLISIAARNSLKSWILCVLKLLFSEKPIGKLAFFILQQSLYIDLHVITAITARTDFIIQMLILRFWCIISILKW